MLSTEWLSAFAPVGSLQGNDLWAACGACVFFHKPQPPIAWMVTANHVVEKVGPQMLTILVTRSSGDGVIVVEVGKILANQGLSWVRDDVNDLAAAPVPFSPDFGIKAVSAELCLPLLELLPSMPCFTVGCPYGLHGVNAQKAIPLVLDGIISGVDPDNHRIYTNAPTFPGNSGGPLIAVRGPFNPAGGAVFGRPIGLLAGIMLETRLVSLPSSTGGIPPLHLGIAVPVDAALALLDSEPAKALIARIQSL